MTRVVQIEPGPIPTFTPVGTVRNQELGGFGRGDIAYDHFQIRINRLDLVQRILHIDRMAMGRIEHDGIDILIDERLHAIHHVGRDADPPPQRADGLSHPYRRWDGPALS